MFKTHKNEAIRPELNEFGTSRSARSILKDKRGLSTSIPESLGALGLGIVVLATAGIGLGAAFNYGQDASAKATLDAVKSAQVLYQGKTGGFGDTAALTTGQDPALPKTQSSLNITKTAKEYCAAIKSESMFPTTYWLTARSGQVLNTKPAIGTSGVTCPDPL